jgi:hypothetical protein
MSAQRQWPAWSPRQVFDRLPACSKTKYRRLKQLADDAGALERSALHKIQLLEGEVSDLIIRSRSVDPAEKETIAAINEEIGTLHADIARLNQERAKRQGTRANTEQVLAYLNEFINTQLGLDRAGADASHFRPITIALDAADREDPKTRLLDLRHEISTIKAEIVALRHAPLTAAEIKQQITRMVDALGAQGAPAFNLAAGKVEIQWPDGNPYAPPSSVRSAPPLGATKMLCRYARDVVLADLLAGIDDAAADGISLAEREQRTNELQARLLLLEHREEAIVVYLLDQNVEVFRRPGASGLALLGIGIDHTAPVESEPLLATVAE